MRHVLTISLLSNIILTALFAGPVNAAEWPLEIVEMMDDKKIVVFVDNRDIAGSPPWRPADGGPPLTIADAMKRVNRWISRENRLAGTQVHEIELKPIHGHEQENRWYYLFQLRNGTNGNRKTHYAIVLFNGKVVPAIAEPASLK